MSFLDRARERALAAGEQLRSAAGQLSGADAAAARVDEGFDDPAEVPATAPAPGAAETPSGMGEALQRGLESARHGLASVVDRLDPRVIADLVIKATSVQERTNAALREKGSPYRIGGLSITASLPPQVSFGIERSAEDEPIAPGADGEH